MRSRRLAGALIGAPIVIVGVQPGPAASAAATNGQKARAVEGVVTSLFTALRQGNYAAACNDYTPDVRALVTRAATKLTGKAFTTCGSALAAIFDLTPTVDARLRKLGAPRYSNLVIRGRTATVTYTSTVGNLIARSEIDVDYMSRRWLVGRATSLTFGKR
jgi:hypothetical protein